MKAVMKVERPECGYVGATGDVIRWPDIADGPRVSFRTGVAVV